MFVLQVKLLLDSCCCCGAVMCVRLRPSPTRSEVSAHAVDGGGLLTFPPGSERDDDDGGVVF